MSAGDLPMTRLQLEGFRNQYRAIIQANLAGATDMEVYELIDEIMATGNVRPECRASLPVLAGAALFDELMRRYEVRELEGN